MKNLLLLPALAGLLQAAIPTLQLKPVAIGQFNSPTKVTHAGDGSGRLFIADQNGQVRILANGAVLPQPFLDLSGKLVSLSAAYDERGLLGLAFHPDYEVAAAAGEGKFYVFYSAPTPNSPGPTSNPVNCRSVLAEFRVSATDPNLADSLSERILISFDKPQSNHNGGEIAFGPADGLLYFATGDGGGGGDDDPGHTGGGLGNAQDRTNLLGKLLRIDPFGSNGVGGQYGIPAANPFVGAGGGIREEIFAYGLGNPWRFSFDSDTNRLFLADVGQGKFEEINLITAGGNYGWRRFEAFADFDAAAPSTGPYIEPVAAYAHPGQAGATDLLEVGLSITGGQVYRGTAIPDLQGKYIFADWSSNGNVPNGTLLGLEEGPPGVFALSKLTVVGGNPIPYYIPTLGVDEAGEIYVATRTARGPSAPAPGGGLSGQLFKIVPGSAAITLTADRDNSILSDFPANSNGAGELFAGVTASSGIRRGLVRFDLSPVPAGSTVSSASVTLQLTRTGGSSGDFSFSLHRLSRDWGEGNSSGNGQGGAAQSGEATWNEAKAGSEAWTTVGGDFIGTASASRLVGGIGSYSWNSPGLATDVQGWLSQPATQFGWILRGDEAAQATRVFASREAAVNRPTLTLQYQPPVPFTRREIWEAQFFPAGTYLDPTDDTDSDRIATLFEYAWDLNPTTGQQLPEFFNVDINIAAGIATVTFRRDPRAVDLVYALETSTGLASWDEVVTSAAGAVPTGPAFVSEMIDPGNSQTRRVVAEIQFTPATDPKLFVRLKVRRP